MSLRAHLEIRSHDRAGLTRTRSLRDALAGLAVSVATGPTEPRSRVVVVRPRSVDLIDAAPLRARGMAPAAIVSGFGATETSHGPAEAIGLLGLTRQGGEVPFASVFLEWEDDRWWWWIAPMDDGQVDVGRARMRDATLGDPMPDGMGRWWIHARRTGARVRLDPLGLGSIH